MAQAWSAKAEWTTADIPSQMGKCILITGANSGIGYQAALTLVEKGAQVILACCDPLKGAAAVQSILRTIPKADLKLFHLDLSSLSSVGRFSDQILALGQPLHCLINNAGVMAPPKRLETEDGFELQFGTNVLGHFVLTARLLPCLTQASTLGAASPRIVTLASIAHKRGFVNFADLQSLQTYSPMAAYAQSKLCDLLFAFELDRRLQAAGSPIASIAVHPGVASTNLFRTGDYHGPERIVREALGPLIGLVLNTDAAGALPTLYAATADTAEGGAYYGPQGFLETRGKHVGRAFVAPQAQDLAVAARLWRICETLSGISVPL